MSIEKIDSYVLTPKEADALPEPLRAQREAHLEYLQAFPTVHPLIDGGTSADDFAHAIVMRVIMDAVTRRVLNGEPDGPITGDAIESGIDE